MLHVWKLGNSLQFNPETNSKMALQRPKRIHLESPERLPGPYETVISLLAAILHTIGCRRIYSLDHLIQQEASRANIEFKERSCNACASPRMHRPSRRQEEVESTKQSETDCMPGMVGS